MSCGDINGHPPLPNWLYGTGIAYIIIGVTQFAAPVLICSVVGIVPWLIISAFTGVFTFAWAIVGAVSLWRDGLACGQLPQSKPFWIMGNVAVVASLVLVVFNCCHNRLVKKHKDEEGEEETSKLINNQ